MNRHCRGLLCALALVIAPFAGAEEQAIEPNAGAKAEVESPEATGVEVLALADALVRLGREYESPMLLIAAAELASQVGPPTELAWERQVDHSADDSVRYDAGEQDDMTVGSILDEARTLAGGDASLGVLIDRTAETAQGVMGRIPGPGSLRGTVSPGGVDSYAGVYFQSRRTAIVSISGDGGSYLELYIYDHNGNLVASGTGPGDQKQAQWTPRITEAFVVQVRNLGNNHNGYVLRTN